LSWPLGRILAGDQDRDVLGERARAAVAELALHRAVVDRPDGGDEAGAASMTLTSWPVSSW
jgi:hypothetical protein